MGGSLSKGNRFIDNKGFFVALQLARADTFN